MVFYFLHRSIVSLWLSSCYRARSSFQDTLTLEHPSLQATMLTPWVCARLFSLPFCQRV